MLWAPSRRCRSAAPRPARPCCRWVRSTARPAGNAAPCVPLTQCRITYTYRPYLGVYSLPLYLRHCLSVAVFICLSLCVSLRLSLCVSLCLSLSVSLCGPLWLCLSLPFSLSRVLPFPMRPSLSPLPLCVRGASGTTLGHLQRMPERSLDVLLESRLPCAGAGGHPAAQPTLLAGVEADTLRAGARARHSLAVRQAAWVSCGEGCLYIRTPFCEDAPYIYGVYLT